MAVSKRSRVDGAEPRRTDVLADRLVKLDSVGNPIDVIDERIRIARGGADEEPASTEDLAGLMRAVVLDNAWRDGAEETLPQLTCCIFEQLKSLRFAVPKNGRLVRADYPFDL
jgi:hypothetical protein